MRVSLLLLMWNMLVLGKKSQSSKMREKKGLVEMIVNHRSCLV